jgi:hypothetical protein
MSYELDDSIEWLWAAEFKEQHLYGVIVGCP